MSTVDVTKNFHFRPMVDGQLTSTGDIILMLIQHFFPSGTVLPHEPVIWISQQNIGLQGVL